MIGQNTPRMNGCPRTRKGGEQGLTEVSHSLWTVSHDWGVLVASRCQMKIRGPFGEVWRAVPGPLQTSAPRKQGLPIFCGEFAPTIHSANVIFTTAQSSTRLCMLFTL